ncbi:MAG: gliding motility-associated-like protein, partial [Bacteroidia bacterium]
GSIIEQIPVSYFVVGDSLHPVEVQYILENGIISFQSSNINIVKTDLVIDPELVFATYAGNSVDNFGFTATYDSAGHLYSGGIATAPDFDFDSTGRYPTTLGAFNQIYNGGAELDDYTFPCDITLNKYSVDGSALIYATFLGGSSNEFPHSIVVNKDNELIVFGTTFSNNFPTSSDAFQLYNKGESDIIVTRFKDDCSDIIGSTYVGGWNADGLNQDGVLKFFYADDFRGEVIVDGNGIIYVASSTQSDDFPIVGGFQSKIGGVQDGVILVFQPELNELIWSSYLGGSNGDALYSVDIDNRGLLYLSGGTRSVDLPKSDAGIGTGFNGGNCDGFVAIVDPVLKTLKKTGYWGTSSYDQIFSLEIDLENKIYVVGQSAGKMPVSSNVYSNAGSGQFISKFDENLDGAEFSTVFGSGRGNPDITINAFLVDECRKIFVSGWGGTTSFKSFSSTNGLPVTKDAYLSETDGSDFYLLVLSKQAKELLYATYFGGTRTDDHVDGGTSRFDEKGVIYQSVCASCPKKSGEHAISDFPTTKGAFAEKNVSPRCSNAAFKIAFGNLNRPPQLTDTLFTMVAFDTLQFTYNITDPDEDSLFVTLTPDPSLRLNNKLINFSSKSKSLATWSGNIILTTLCEDVGDTLTIGVYAIDKGCPSILDSTATIRVVVTPPPVLEPPPTLCLNFTSESSLTIFWEAIATSKYYGNTKLFRINPNGSEELIYTTSNSGAGSFADLGLNLPKFNEYIYYIVVTNICDKDGPPSYRVSTTREFEFPVKGSYVITATVTDGQDVQVVWTSTDEDDFGRYNVYRKKNYGKGDFEYYASTYNRTDTTFIDKNVDVDETSYCYNITVSDNCGHVSKASNYGCTIVLEGQTSPFEHRLFWNEYVQWENDVERYDLSRSVDTGSLRFIETFEPSNRYHKDTLFDYDWGGYWYRVRAFENPGTFNAISQSNRIYLIQPPLLHVPNAFTPNGDGLNEIWGIVPVFVKEYQLQVFDRWGGKVFDTDNKKQSWDGFVKNVQTSNSVYVYYIRFTGWDHSIHYRKGTVTILK